MRWLPIYCAVLCCCALSSATLADDKWVTYQGWKGPGQGRRIVLLSGDEEYRSEEALPMLGKLLAVKHGFTCTVLFAQDPETGEIDPNNQTHIPGMHLLKQADLVILALRFRELPDEEMRHFDDYVKSGKPLIALRTSTHAFNYSRNKQSPFAKYSFNARGEWNGGFGQQVLGETWVSHHGAHGRESTRGVARREHQDHPILKGVEDVWGPTDVYGVIHLPDDAQVLMDGQVLAGMKPDDPPKPQTDTMPLVWVREYPSPGGRNKILCTTMGASVDFENEGLRRLIVNGAYWATGFADKIPDRADVDPVGDYHPTFFGFNKFTKGVKVSDHKLDQ
jgi:type 1 glutamine amidotransferase